MLFLSVFLSSTLSFRRLLLGLVLFSYLLRLIFSRGFGEIDHSLANMMISEMAVVVFFIAFAWVYFMLKLCLLGSRSTKALLHFENGKKNECMLHLRGCKWFYTWVISQITIGYIVYITKLKGSCGQVDRGLISSSSILYDQGDCVWQKSDICWYYVTEGLMSPVFWGRDKCAYQNDDLTLYH